MKFTATDLFKAIALGSGKYIQCRAYFRITSTLSDPLDSGVAWTDCSLYLASDEGQPKLPTMWTKAEWQVGKSTFDSISLDGIDIPFWRDKVFGACSSTQLIEFKIELKLGLSESVMASDVVYGFSGYIDQVPAWKEKEGIVTFTVIAQDEIGQRTSAEVINNQIINSDVNGSGLAGIRLERLAGLYVTNANISSYQLRVGIHAIQLTYTAGTPNVWTASLDGGTEVTLPTSDGAITLGNGNGTIGDVNQFDNQKVTLYVKVAELSPLTETTPQGIIQRTLGDTLPYTWYSHCWIFQLLKTLYAKIGLTNYTFDNFKISTSDGRKAPSFWDVPPGDSYYSNPSAIACDNTNNLVWIGIKDRVYSHNMTSHIYTLVGTVPSGYTVVRLWSDDIASGFIWGVARNAAGAHKVIKIVVSSSTLTTYTINRTETAIAEERNFAIDLSVRGIFFIAQTIEVHLFLLNSLTEISHSFGSNLLSTYPAFADGAGNYYVQSTGTGISNVQIQKAHYNGSWTTSIISGTWTYGFNNAAYSATLGVWIGCQVDATVRKWDPSTNTLTIIDTDLWAPSGFVADEVHGWMYYCWIDTDDNNFDFTRVKRANNSTVEAAGDAFPPGYYVGPVLSYNPETGQVCYDSVNDRLVGISGPSGILFEYGSKVSMFIDREADWTGMSVIDAIKEIESSFNLVGVISPNKKIVLYRRSDESGNPKTSGNTASITVAETEDIQKEENYVRSCTAVIVSNGVETHSYNGTSFDAGLLGDGRILTVDGRFIPTPFLKDMAYYFYQFFNKNLSMYTFPTANVSLWQYECFDGLSVTFTSTKIQKTATGPLYGVGIDPSGSTIFQVLL